MTLSSFPTGTFIVSIKTGCLTFSGHTAFFLPFVSFPSLQMDGIRKNDQRDFEEQLIFGITLLLLNITVWSFSYNQFTVFYLFNPDPSLNVYFSWRGIWDCLLSKQFDAWCPSKAQAHQHRVSIQSFWSKHFPSHIKIRTDLTLCQALCILIFLHFPDSGPCIEEPLYALLRTLLWFRRVFYQIDLPFFNDITDISKIQLVVYHQCCVLIGWATTRLYVIAHATSRAERRFLAE